MKYQNESQSTLINVLSPDIYMLFASRGSVLEKKNCTLDRRYSFFQDRIPLFSIV